MGEVQVHITYEATVESVITLPDNMTIEEIIKEVKGGVNYYHRRDDEDDISIGEMVELIVDGELVNLGE